MFTFLCAVPFLRKRRRPGAARLATRAGVTVRFVPRLWSARIRDHDRRLSVCLHRHDIRQQGHAHRYGVFAEAADRPGVRPLGRGCHDEVERESASTAVYLSGTRAPGDKKSVFFIGKTEKFPRCETGPHPGRPEQTTRVQRPRNGLRGFLAG